MLDRDLMEPGTLVGRYQIEKALGSGGFGIVYAAHDESGRRVALKVARKPSTSISAYQLVLQQNEIEVLTRLSHPSLVAMLGYGFLPDRRMYFVMEMVEGELLSEHLARRGALEAVEAIRIVRRIAEALAYCHEANALHLDLKPSNIIITDPYEPHIKVLDFGLACFTGYERQLAGSNTAVAGTLPYMGPELFLGKRAAVSAKTDLYALGVILYELLTGHLPLATADSAEMVTRKCNGALLPIEQVAPGLPASLVQLVHSLLAVEPTRRPASAAAVASRLKGVYYDTLRGVPTEMHGSAPEEDASSLFDLVPENQPLVGRACERQQLSDALRASIDGAGQAALIIGEAGLGKSRLVSEILCQRDVAAQVLVAYGRCRQLGELVPYSALREALAQLHGTLQHGPAVQVDRFKLRLGEVGDDGAAVLRGLVPELDDLLPLARSEDRRDTIGPLAIGADLVAKAVLALLARITIERPFALVLEDIHWSDQGTLAVIERLVVGELPGRLLVLLTTRPGEQLPQGATLRRIELSPLGEDDNRALLGELTGNAEPAVLTELMRSVPLLAAGNPLVNTQIVRNLWSEGYLQRESSGAVTLSQRIREDYKPPDSVVGVIKQTLERLDDGAVRVLEVAALIDRQFYPVDLEHLGLFAPAEVYAAVASAAAQKVLWVHDDRCTFSHDTILERLQASIEPDRLPDIHARLAARLQARGVPAGTLGYHLEKAGQAAAAAAAYREAAGDAERLHDPLGATRHLRKVFDLLEALPASAQRDDLLVDTAHELVRISCHLGATSDMLDYLDRASARLPDRTTRQGLALDSAYARTYYTQGNFAKAVEFSSRCLAARSDDPTLRRYPYIPSNVLGRALCGTGKFGPSVPVLTQGCELALEAGEYTELTHSEGLLGAALGYTGQYEEGYRRVDHSWELAHKLEDRVRILAAYFYYTCLAEASFDWDRGVKVSIELLSFAEENSIGGLYFYVGTLLAGRHQFHIGHLDRARVILANARNLSLFLGIQLGAAWTRAFLGDVELVSGQLDAAKAAYEDALVIGSSVTKDELGGPHALIGLAHHAALTGGDPAQIRRLADEAISRFRAVGNLASLVVALQRYAEALTEVGDGKGAEPISAEHAKLVARLGVTECEFWPRIVAPVEPSIDHRTFWHMHQRSVAQHNVDAMADTRGGTLAETISPPPEPAVLGKLATEIGFVPEFATRMSNK